MKKVPITRHSVYVWPYEPNSEDKHYRHQSKHFGKRSIPRKEQKQTPEQMIRSLKGVFCKGRYLSLALLE